MFPHLISLFTVSTVHLHGQEESFLSPDNAVLQQKDTLNPPSSEIPYYPIPYQKSFPRPTIITAIYKNDHWTALQYKYLLFQPCFSPAIQISSIDNWFSALAA